MELIKDLTGVSTNEYFNLLKPEFEQEFLRVKGKQLADINAKIEYKADDQLVIFNVKNHKYTPVIYLSIEHFINFIQNLKEKPSFQ